MLRKIECYLAPGKLDALRDLLLKNSIEGMSVLSAEGFGTRSKKNKGKPEFEKRIKVEIVLDEQRVDAIISGIRKLAVDGSIGAGMIFVVPIEDALRLSTREVGKSAIL
jgi:nitrogen regulatory protein P-II 1